MSNSSGDVSCERSSNDDLLPTSTLARPPLSSGASNAPLLILIARFFPPLLVACASFIWIYALSAYVSPAYFGIGNDNFWFDADVPRYLCQIVDVTANDHWRNKVHPLFSFLVSPLPNALHLLGIDVIRAIRIQIALVVAVGMLFYYLLLRAMGLRMLASLLLTSLLATSASVLAWFTIVESYAYTFTAFSMMLYFLVTAMKRKESLARWSVLIGFSFAITVTNVVVTGIAALQALGLRRVLWAGGFALVAVTVLAIAQRLFFPLSGIFFLPSAFAGEATFMVQLSGERLHELMMLVLYGSFLFAKVSKTAVGNEQMLTTHGTGFELDALPLLCMVLLSCLFLLGVWPLLCRLRQSYKSAISRKQALVDDHLTMLALPTLGGLAFLFSLHSVYGKEAFLYTGSFLPLLGILLAVGLQSEWVRKTRTALPLLVVLVSGNIVHNVPAFTGAASQLRDAAARPLQQHSLKRKACPFVKRQLLSAVSATALPRT